MFKHILKLIWKKRKSNFLMMLEIFISFIILFAVWSLGVYTFRNYLKPIGWSSDNVWAMFVNFNAPNDTLRNAYKELVARELKNGKDVADFSFSGSNIPYAFSSYGTNYAFNGKEVGSNVFRVDPSYFSTLNIPLKAGRWFTSQDTMGAIEPVLLNRHLAKALFGDADPLNQIIGNEGAQRRVVGMIDDFKHESSFQEEAPCSFEYASPWENDLVLKMKQGANAETEAKLIKQLQSLGKDWTIEIQHLANMKKTKDNIIIIPILILFGVCIFLVFNVGMGLLGVLFQNISRRRGEIGLRRAIGATQKQILLHFIGETLMIAAFGITLGFFFAVQLPLLHVFNIDTGVYLWGIVLAIISILLIVVLSAFYPSKQAAAVFPAVALHEE